METKYQSPYGNQKATGMFQYSEISITGEIPKGLPKKAILASALNDWGCCMAGASIPENFGMGMAKVGLSLDVVATHENLLNLKL